MGNAKYGMPYKGSKTRIADELIAVLPPARHFYDCFGGGGAMTHAAALSGKYEHVYYNEFNPLVADAFRRALAGDTPDPSRWISREDFDRLKESDFQTALMWSFSTRGNFYMYAPEREPWYEAVHHAFFVVTFPNFTASVFILRSCLPRSFPCGLKSTRGNCLRLMSNGTSATCCI